EAAFQQYERSEAGWKLAHVALIVLRPEGHLNDRAWAEQQLALALPLLSGREWSKAARLPPGTGDVDVPGPSAPSVARSGPRGPVARGVGAVVVAAPAASPRTPREPLGVRAMWRIWCNRLSARRWARIGERCTRPWRGPCAWRTAPAVR